MRRRSTRPAVTLAVCCAALAGCRSDTGPLDGTAGLEQQATTWATNLIVGDGPAACSHMDAGSQRAAEAATNTSNCIQAVATYSRTLPSEVTPVASNPTDSGTTGTIDLAIGTKHPYKDLGISPTATGRYTWSTTWGWELTGPPAPQE